MQHIIKKQVINLVLDAGTDAFHIQHLVSEHYKREVLALLEKAFDDISTEEEIIRLDQLEIDLGRITVQDIEKGRWTETVLKKLTELLISIKNDPSSREKRYRLVIPIHASEQWLFYMQHGYLPWHTLQTGGTWYQNVLEAFAGDPAAIGQLRSLIRNNRGAVKRITFQHKEHFKTALLETLTAEKQDLLPKILEEAAEVIGYFEQGKGYDTPLARNKFLQKLWQEVLLMAAQGEKKFTPHHIARYLFTGHLPEREWIQKLPRNFLSDTRLTASMLQQIIQVQEGKKGRAKEDDLVSGADKNFLKPGPDSTPGKKEPGTKEPAENKVPEVPMQKTADSILHTRDKMPPDRTVETKGISLIDEEGIFILNAGIVLLNPFLDRFFTHLQLVKKGRFTDPLSQQKALYLLHYLATGKTEAQEHELLIAKVLCDWPIEEPVEDLIELTTDEIGAANGLLTEAIQQWEIIKNTSPAGLREGFLQRSGKLVTRNNNLYIQVETSSIDVLLKHLPMGWSLHMIFLPWRSDILRVEWG